MILTCPDCQTRYSIDANTIGANGNTVRCSNCGASWFVSADPDLMALHDNAQAEMEPLAPSASPEEPQHTHYQSRDRSEDEALASHRHDEDYIDANMPTEPVMGAHVQIRDQVDRARRNRRMMGVSMVWIITLGALFLAAIFGFAMRQSIVDRFPSTASVYKAFGMSVKYKGLDLQKPTTRNVLVDGQHVLIVNGFIENKSNETVPIPMIEISLNSNSGEKLVHWIVEPQQSTLAPKSNIEYVTQYPNPPIDAINLTYKFVNDVNPTVQSSPIGTPDNN